MSGDTGVFDLYGFELSVTPADKSDRYDCAQYAQRREAKWEPYLKAQRLPEGRTLKRFVRKVWRRHGPPAGRPPPELERMRRGYLGGASGSGLAPLPVSSAKYHAPEHWLP
jgi:hypothetical protein